MEIGTTSDAVNAGGAIYFSENTNGGELQFRLFILNLWNVSERISVQSVTKFHNYADTWKHCTVNWNGTTNTGNMKIYIDGKFDNQNGGGNSVQKNWLGPWRIGDGVQSSQLTPFLGDIASLSIPYLKSIEGNVTIRFNSLLTKLQIVSLASVGKELIIGGNKALTNLDLGSLHNVGRLFIADADLSTLDIENLNIVDNDFTIANLGSKLTTLDVHNLVSVGTGISIFKNTYFMIQIHFV